VVPPTPPDLSCSLSPDAYKPEVEGFETLRRSEESEALRFFGSEELPELDVITTARPILDSYLSADVRQGILLD
jgi:hypothetical protein